MMADIKPLNQVLHQDLALDVYLKTLLDDIPANQPEEKLTDGKQQKQKRIIKSPVKTTKRRQDKVQATSHKVEQIATARSLSIMPKWARDGFQVLLFRVDQLVLATPLIDLQRTLKIDDSMTKIPGQPSWFLGMIEDQGHKIAVLDTGQLVFGKTQGSKRKKEEQHFRSLLILHGNKWGLACDEVLSISQMLPEKIRWRTHRKKRPWLIGTAIDELTAIIDVNQLLPQGKATGNK